MKFDMSRAWNDAMAVVNANRDVLLIVAGVFFFLPGLAVALLTGGFVPQDGATPEQMMTEMGVFYRTNWPWFIIIVVAQAVGMMAMLALLTDRSRPTVGEAIGVGFKSFLPYIGVQILIAIGAAIFIGIVAVVAGATGSAALAVILGLVAFVVFVYAMIKLSIVIPVIVIERVMNPIAALIRSWKLTKGNSFRLLLFYVLLAIAFGIVYFLIVALLTLPFSLLLDGEALRVISAIVSGLVGAVAVTYYIAVLAAVHRQLAGPSHEAVAQTFE